MRRSRSDVSNPSSSRRDPATSTAVLSQRLRLAAERLGPTYIKLGQIISGGEGLFPDETLGQDYLVTFPDAIGGASPQVICPIPR